MFRRTRAGLEIGDALEIGDGLYAGGRSEAVVIQDLCLGFSREFLTMLESVGDILMDLLLKLFRKLKLLKTR